MSIPRPPILLIEDMISAAGKAAAFAIVRALEIIGEAAKRVPPGVRALAPGVVWSDIVGMRNKLAHDYIHVDLDVVWSTVSNDLPPLVAELERLRFTLAAAPPEAP